MHSASAWHWTPISASRKSDVTQLPGAVLLAGVIGACLAFLLYAGCRALLDIWRRWR